MKRPTLALLLLVTLPVNLLLAEIVPVPDTAEPEILPDAQPRNVVFILSDDHRYDAMGFMGHPLAVTPAMDQLATDGVHLSNALVTTALCSPSRASILTGLYTFRHRVIDNVRHEPPGTLYFSQYLQAAGYRTAFIGKWHMGDKNDDPRPGFDHWVSFAGQGYYHPEGNTLNVNGEDVPQRGYITTELTDYAIDWLEQQRDTEEPFFLYLSHKAVHALFQPEEKYLDSLADHPIPELPRATTDPAPEQNTPRWLRDQKNSYHGVNFLYEGGLDLDLYYRRYGESLRSLDDSIARVMAQLEDMGIADETLVIYMGDNGFMFGEHGLIDKRVAYETSIRVPLLVRCPELFDGGQVVEEVVANIDIAPTIMEAMGLATPAHMDGQSFLPLTRGEEIPWRDQFLYVYYWEKVFPQCPTVFALRTDRYKYINTYGLWDADELYDLQNDPGETMNLRYTAGYEDIVTDLHHRLYAMMAELGGMDIPLNLPVQRGHDLRHGPRGGQQASDFPEPLIDRNPSKDGPL